MYKGGAGIYLDLVSSKHEMQRRPVRDQAGRGGAVNTIITDYPPPAATSCLLPPDSWLLPPASWLLAPGSCLLAPGSWLLAPTSDAHLHPVQFLVRCSICSLLLPFLAHFLPEPLVSRRQNISFTLYPFLSLSVGLIVKVCTIEEPLITRPATLTS